MDTLKYYDNLINGKLKKVYTLETFDQESNLIYKVDFIAKYHKLNKHYIKANKQLNELKIHCFSLSNKYLTDKEILNLNI